MAANDNDSQESMPKLPLSLQIGLGVFGLVNVGMLLSLPPVLRGKGAPYLPTFSKNMDAMFQQLREHAKNRRNEKKLLRFVDLGSGDGRLVFRAAREGYYGVGYEINPMLHVAAQAQRILWPRYWSTTQFYWQDIWKVDLRDTDVVAVVSGCDVGGSHFLTSHS